MSGSGRVDGNAGAPGRAEPARAAAAPAPPPPPPDQGALRQLLSLLDAPAEAVVPPPPEPQEMVFAPPVEGTGSGGSGGGGGGGGEDGSDGQSDAERQAAFRGDDILAAMLGSTPAPAVEAPAPAAAAALREVAEAVVERVLVGRDGQGDDLVTIKLGPDVFGGAEISVTRKQGELQVSIVATDPEALAQLRKAMPALGETLAGRLGERVRLGLSGEAGGGEGDAERRSRGLLPPWP